MGRFTLERSRVIDAAIDAVWPVVAAAARYHEVADTLEHTEIVSGNGVGMVRHCRDTRGREWFETCTLWEPGRRYRMAVDIDTYPASYRALFSRLEGTWAVESVDEGTELTLRFDGDVRLGPIGKAAVAAMGRDSVLDAILDGYERLVTEAA